MDTAQSPINSVLACTNDRGTNSSTEAIRDEVPKALWSIE